MDIVIRDNVGHIVVRLEPRCCDANIFRQIATHFLFERFDNGSDTVAAVKNVVHNEEAVLPIGVPNDVFQGVHPDLLVPFVNTVIG